MSPPGGPPAFELVLASGNPGKLAELRALLADLPLALRDLSTLPGVELPEEGLDYEANAVAKAQTVARAAGCAALGEDSGLEVAALGGAPGPRSARFGGEGLDAKARTAALLEALGDARDRRARFVCVAALALPDGRVALGRGRCTGRILDAPRGAGGFGYDPIFEADAARGRSMAELAPQEKHALSHRAAAVRALLPALRREVLGEAVPPGD